MQEDLGAAQVSTFLSRDAGIHNWRALQLLMMYCTGRSWVEVSKGPSVYAFTNHGAIVVRAEQHVQTNDVRSPRMIGC